MSETDQRIIAKRPSERSVHVFRFKAKTTPFKDNQMDLLDFIMGERVRQKDFKLVTRCISFCIKT